MSTKQCQHVHANGVLCKAPPLRKRNYCFFHLDQLGRRMKAARVRARCQAVPLNLPLFEDLYSVQVGLMQVADAIAHDEIEVQRGRLLMSVMRLAASNLKSAHGWESSSRFQLDENTAYALLEHNHFEQEYDLPKNFDLSVDAEVAFPPPNPKKNEPTPPSLAGSQDRDLPLGANLGNESAPQDRDLALRSKLGHILKDAETPIPGSPVNITADVVEIWDVMQREGDEAALKVIAEQERIRRRRARRLQRGRYEEMARNRTIQLAAQKLVDDQQLQAPAAAAALDGVLESNANVGPVAETQAQASASHAPGPAATATSAAGQTVEAANAPGPAEASTLTAPTEAGTGVPSRAAGLDLSGVEAAGGILGTGDHRAESSSDGSARKPPQTQGSSAATTASKGGS